MMAFSRGQQYELSGREMVAAGIRLDMQDPFGYRDKFKRVYRSSGVQKPVFTYKVACSQKCERP